MGLVLCSVFLYIGLVIFFRDKLFSSKYDLLYLLSPSSSRLSSTPLVSYFPGFSPLFFYTFNTLNALGCVLFCIGIHRKFFRKGCGALFEMWKKEKSNAIRVIFDA